MGSSSSGRKGRKIDEVEGAKIWRREGERTGNVTIGLVSFHIETNHDAV